jgi:hypothetical protein
MLPPISDEQMMWYILKGYTIDVDVFGNREWWRNGQLHREDGPAIEYASGNRYWYLNDRLMTEEEHRKLTQKKMANIG